MLHDSDIARAVRSLHMPEDTRRSLAAKLDTLPRDGEIYQTPEDRTHVLRYALTALAACAVLTLTGAAIHTIRQAETPPLAPGTEQAACYDNSFTPFGNLSGSTLGFAYPPEFETDSMIPEGTMLLVRDELPPNLTASLLEVFRVCGWEPIYESALSDTQKAIPQSGDYLIMHIYRDANDKSSECATAYFQFDTHITRVDVAGGGSTWYALDDECIRCLRSIVIDQQETAYTPLERCFGTLAGRIRNLTDSLDADGITHDLTAGQEAMLDQYLDSETFYPWNYLRNGGEHIPSGRCLTLHLQNSEGDPETVDFFTEIGCIKYTRSHTETYTDAAMTGTDARTYGELYWVDDERFMEQMEALLLDGICPLSPVGDVTAWESVTVGGEILPTEQAQALKAQLAGMQWKEIECPVNPASLADAAVCDLLGMTGDEGTALRLYPEIPLMTTVQALPHADGASVTHYLELTDADREALSAILNAAPVTADAAAEYGDAPFGDLTAMSLYCLTDASAPELLSLYEQDVALLSQILHRASYTPLDPDAGVMATGASVYLYANDSGIHSLLHFWEDGTVAVTTYPTDGEPQTGWYQADPEIYFRPIQTLLQSPADRVHLRYETRGAIEQNPEEVFAQIFPTNCPPCGNLLLRSDTVVFCNAQKDELNAPDAARLPADGVDYTVDLAQVEAHLEQLVWEESDPAVYNDEAYHDKIVGMLEMRCGAGQLLIGTEPDAVDGNILVLWNAWDDDGIYTPHRYHADLEWAQELVRIAADTAKPLED